MWKIQFWQLHKFPARSARMKTAPSPFSNSYLGQVGSATRMERMQWTEIIISKHLDRKFNVESSPRSLGDGLIIPLTIWEECSIFVRKMSNICEHKEVSSGCPVAGETMLISQPCGTAQFYPWFGYCPPNTQPSWALAPLSSKGCRITMLKATLTGRAHTRYCHFLNRCNITILTGNLLKHFFSSTSFLPTNKAIETGKSW